MVREEVHSLFLILGNYYNGEKEVEETKILVETKMIECKEMDIMIFSKEMDIMIFS